ncbi:MAG: DVUA0089 family protein [Janthinobacterium lividum]
MSFRRLVPCAVLALGFTLSPLARADSSVTTGTLAADNSVYSDSFSVASAGNYTFTTTSAATGGFLPVLTLFNAATGLPVDFSNSGLGDVSLSDPLASGSYILDVTEFPNEAVGNLSDGFLFASDSTATGDACGGSLSGHSFINSITCSATPLSDNFTLDTTSASVSSTAVTPEPSTFLLMLAPAAGLVKVVRRRRVNA